MSHGAMQMTIKIQQCQLLRSSRALQQQQQSCSPNTAPESPRTEPCHNGPASEWRPPSWRDADKTSAHDPFWRASTSTAFWSCIWAACAGICIIFLLRQVVRRDPEPQKPQALPASWERTVLLIKCLFPLLHMCLSIFFLQVQALIFAAS